MSTGGDKLLFCNQPERMTQGGAHADAQLKKGQTYRIFFITATDPA
jgi:hypothetical protein